ncbi:UDP-glucose dehydrogenase family protein [Paenibacillus puerhi]|uniref:UDP-glucose dehydrogenase family protein n=1 Tax=Paenibacillus puerhi TaxID=2692622 RepID=UPI0013595DA5|nr:UDP-glucose/GDP-mannose dehydrogenase family protein [Paenibacillus puerhi]
MNILIMGTGYVGVTTGLLFAELGHQVTGLDPDREKVNTLSEGLLTFYEPGLDRILWKHVRAGSIRFTTDASAAIRDHSIIFICVGTPSREDGSADLRYMGQAATQIGQHTKEYKLVVMKSTVPVGTCEQLTHIIREAQPAPISFDVVSNPEFLREGNAWHDALHPDRIVIGALHASAAVQVRQLYDPLDSPVLVTTPRTAELMKYAANAFLATKISFINEISRLCEVIDVPVTEVSAALGMDHRIGPHFLNAGLGYGGSCFPKDIQALLHIAAGHDLTLGILEQADHVNRTQIPHLLRTWEQAIGSFHGKTIAVLGLSFKPDTDDLREAPALKLISLLAARETAIRVHDPVATLPSTLRSSQIQQFGSIEETLAQCDAVILCSEWPTYKEADWARLHSLMRDHYCFDGRNMLDGNRMAALGFHYYGVGIVQSREGRML